MGGKDFFPTMEGGGINIFHYARRGGQTKIFHSVMGFLSRLVRLSLLPPLYILDNFDFIDTNILAKNKALLVSLKS